MLQRACYAVVLLLPACFHPVYGPLACGPGGECPSGFTCSAAFVCENGDMANSPDGPACRTDGDCKMAGLPACETMMTVNHGICEPCTASNIGVCTGTTPRCENNACVGCVDDVQDCKGGVCLATGTCADPSQIIHAASTSTRLSGCGDASMPCSLTGAFALVTATKNIIKLDDTGPFLANGFTVSSDVTIDAHGATLTRVDDKGAVLTVTAGMTLTLLGGTIQGGHGAMGSGILCNGGALVMDETTITTNDQSGIDSMNCTLTITRARIESNNNQGGQGIRATGGVSNIARSWFDKNKGDGLKINDSKFTIVGNVFVNNGDMASQIGGISISTSTAGNRLEFNSIAGNNAQQTAPAIGSPGGILCIADSGFTAKNNVIWDNNSYFCSQSRDPDSGCMPLHIFGCWTKRDQHWTTGSKSQPKQRPEIQG